MRHNTHDKTLYRNYVRKWKFLIQEYELVKQKRHPTFRFVADFYRFHQTHRQTFFKYYHRFRQSGAEHALVPQPRGPKWKSRRVYGYIEQQVLQQRRLGVNRYEICQILAPKLKHLTPSPSTVYRITQRYGLNRLTPKLREEKRRIVKQKAGELGHLDCHHLSKDLIATDPTRYYLVCVIDACTRLAWAEVVTDLKSLTVMFSALKSFNLLHQRYQLQFAEVLTDNGSEFAAPRTKDTHPFERMLLELGIKHRYTRPYRPQTNGKVERFWRTLNDDLIDGTTFASLAEFRDELEQYLLYYNEVRPHQALEGQPPNRSTNLVNELLNTYRDDRGEGRLHRIGGSCGMVRGPWSWRESLEPSCLCCCLSGTGISSPASVIFRPNTGSALPVGMTASTPSPVKPLCGNSADTM